MNLHKINKKKIFVTGHSGNGKTSFAKEYSILFNIQYIDFDENWTYGNVTKETYDKIIGKYTDEFITDAIPFATIDDEFLFLDYYNKNKEDIKIVCVCCTDFNELHNRRENIDRNKLYEDYSDFYQNGLKFYMDFPGIDIEFYDSFKNEYITYNQLRNRVRKSLQKEFKSYLDSLSYDKYYGAIECINFPGYTESVRTWNNIKDLVDWKDKKVADLGCFHGYFGFKAAQAGAKVTGFDQGPPVLKTCSIINFIEDNPIEELIRWRGGEEIPEEYEISLALNVIHHFDDLKLSLQNIKSKIVIFEVNQDEVPQISELYNIQKRVNSHRHSVKGVDRVILLCEKK